MQDAIENSKEMTYEQYRSALSDFRLLNDRAIKSLLKMLIENEELARPIPIHEVVAKFVHDGGCDKKKTKSYLEYLDKRDALGEWHVKSKLSAYQKLGIPYDEGRVKENPMSVAIGGTPVISDDTYSPEFFKEHGVVLREVSAQFAVKAYNLYVDYFAKGDRHVEYAPHDEEYGVTWETGARIEEIPDGRKLFIDRVLAVCENKIATREERRKVVLKDSGIRFL